MSRNPVSFRVVLAKPGFGSKLLAQHQLASLPTEVLVEILKNAHWHDLLTIRRVCKRYNEISKSKAVWESQYTRFAAEKTFMPAIEEPLQSYSSEELEKWVLNRRSAELAWGLDGQAPRERKLEIPPACPWTLVPGGRWLLAVMRTGSLNSYDLDQENIVSTKLTPPHDPPRVMYRISIDMMPMATLSFNLAIYSIESDDHESHGGVGDQASPRCGSLEREVGPQADGE
ncbi:hypothetical protein H0H92_005505 [Tricholoma furcatifolium]|nr:hypothetical protein H0H92_005505 [Tricholoma furcatifolium]